MLMQMSTKKAVMTTAKNHYDIIKNDDPNLFLKFLFHYIKQRLNVVYVFLYL